MFQYLASLMVQQAKHYKEVVQKKLKAYWQEPTNNRFSFVFSTFSGWLVLWDVVNPSKQNMPVAPWNLSLSARVASPCLLCLVAVLGSYQQQKQMNWCREALGKSRWLVIGCWVFLCLRVCALFCWLVWMFSYFWFVCFWIILDSVGIGGVFTPLDKLEGFPIRSSSEMMFWESRSLLLFIFLSLGSPSLKLDFSYLLPAVWRLCAFCCSMTSC